MVWTQSASTPANGPSPTATTNSIANTTSLIARAASISRRTGWRTQTGAMLADERRPNGIAHSTERAVPQTAIWSVTSISSA